MENQIGKVLKSYHLQDLIGSGGFGAVYKAKQDVVERDVAIKIIYPAFANHPNFIRRFEAEAQLVASLEHPYIVPLYDYWRDPDGAYIVMRWLRGGALRDVQDGSQWALQDVNRLVHQIASALALAHRYDVVHRDIKPENILLDRDSNAYLADFGIAQIVSNASEEGDMMVGMGSPAYAPPEQILGGSTSPASDIYSLGVIVYELLVGQHPFPDLEDLSMTELNEMRAKATLPMLFDTRNDISRQIDDVLQKASAIHPKERFSDAMAFARAFNDAMGGNGRSFAGTRTSAINDVIQNPYKGLRAFQEIDAANFFGRSALVDRLIDRLKEDGPYARFLAIVGPSGSGKSSVVRAGLIPELRNGAIDGARQWYYDQVIPGEDPFSEIENAIISLAVEPPENLMKRLLADKYGMLNAINDVLPTDGSELLLFIDQFEEVFTLTEDDAQINKFLQSLYVAVTDPRSRIRVIITIRADFYDRPLLQPRLSDMVRERTEVVVPLSEQELEHVIMEPARGVGVMIDHGLVASIVAEVKEQPGSLPLLQYTLSELFEQRDGTVITPDIYRELGGVRGALAKRAQEIYESLTSEEQRAVRQLFLRLITLGEGTEDTRRRALMTEITSIRTDEDFMADDSVMRRVVDIMGKARLVSFDRDPVTRSPTVEVTHEAIIREWETLRNWLDESRNDVRMQRTLANLASEWNNNRRDVSYLMRGVRLESYEKWIQDSNVSLTETERVYLAESSRMRQERLLEEQQRVERERMLEQRALSRTRILVVVFAVAAVVASALSAYAFVLSNQANRASAESRSIAWEASARQVQAQGEGDLAILLALQAIDMENPPPQSYSTLAEVAFSEGTRRVFSGHEALVQDVAFSPDGRLVASASTDATVKIWDVDTGEIIHNLTAHGGDVESVVFSPDGQTLVSTATDFLAIVWDIASGEEILRLSTAPEPVREVAFTPIGDQLLTVSNRGMVILWDITTGEEIRRFDGHQATVLTVAMHPTEMIALTGGRDSSMYLWNLEDGTGTSLAGHGTQINDIEFDATGTFAVSASGDGEIIVWDARTGEFINSFGEGLGEVRDIEISYDGLLVYAASVDGVIQVFDIETGLIERQLVGHSDVVSGLTISADGQTLASGSLDTSIRLWNVGLPGAEAIFDLHTGRVQDVAISTDGTRFFTASTDQFVLAVDSITGDVLRTYDLNAALYAIDVVPDASVAVVGSRSAAYVLNLETGEIIFALNDHSGRINDIVVFADGTRALTGSLDNTIILWDVTTGNNLRTFDGHDASVNALAILPDETQFISASSDGTLRRWDINTGQELAIYDGHSSLVTAVAIHPDGSQMISGGRDDFIIVWDIESSNEVTRIVIDEDAVWAVDYNATGDRVAISAENGLVLVWSIAETSEVERFDKADSNVFTVSFAPDGTTLLSGQDDGSVVTWRLYPVPRLVEWIRDNRYLREWSCIEVDQYVLPDGTPCAIQ